MLNRKTHITGSITSSQEDYLECIYDLSLKDEKVKSIAVAKTLHVSRASVNKSLAGLKEDGYIEQSPYGPIVLTQKGKEIAKDIRTKHNALKAFLVEVLGVEEEVADMDACEMEHSISRSTANKLYAYLKNQGIPRNAPK